MPRLACLKLLAVLAPLSACSSSYKAENLYVDVVNSGDIDPSPLNPEQPLGRTAPECNEGCPQHGQPNSGI